jgi:hypothetical protein
LVSEVHDAAVVKILALTFCPGFSSNTDTATYKVEDEKKKLTIEEMNA